MSSIDDLLAFAQPVDINDPKEVARKNLNMASEQLLASAKEIHDKEDSREGQEMWLREWNGRLAYVRECLGAAKVCGAEQRLGHGVGDAMKSVNSLMKKWSDDQQKKRDEDERRCKERKKASPAQDKLTTIQPDVTVDETVSKTMTEEVVSSGRLRVGPPPRGAKKLPSVVVTLPLPKRAHPMVLDNEDDEEELERPIKKMNMMAFTPPTIVHPTPCEACAGRAEPCNGPKGRTCFWCVKKKRTCNKSLGRGGRNRWNEEPEATKGKGKAPVQPARTTCHKVSVKETGEVSDDINEEEEAMKKPPKRPTKRAEIAQQDTVTASTRNNTIQVVKRLEGGLLGIQSQAKTMEAELVALKEVLGME